MGNEKIINGAELHYLSTNSIYLEPLYITQMKQRMEELKNQLKSELEFTEILHKEGLLEFYLREKYKKAIIKSKENKNKC